MRLRAFVRTASSVIVLLHASTSHGGGLTPVEQEPTSQPVMSVVTTTGTHVYAVSDENNSPSTLWVYDRDAISGELDFKASYVDGTAGVDDIERASGLAVSPDGANVYVSGEFSDAVVTFARNGGDGTLTYLESERHNVGAVPASMRAPTAVAVSPDNAHVYVTSRLDDSIVIFARDLAPVVPADLGQLDYVGVIEQSPGSCALPAGPCGLDFPQAMAFSPDGLFLYVAAHDAGSGAISVFQRNPGTGLLTFLEYEKHNANGVEAMLNPTALVVSSAPGSHIYVASPLSNAMQVFSRDTDPMSPTWGEITFVETHRDSSATNGLLGAYGVAINPDGRYVYVTGRDENALVVFRRDTTTGKLLILESFIDKKTLAHGLAGPRGVTIDATGAHLYVSSLRGLGGIDGVLSVFAIDTCGDGNRGSDEQCDDDDLDSGDGCSSLCKLETCEPTPAVGCVTTGPELASITIKNDPAKLDTADQVQFKWTNSSIPIADLGDPLAGTSDYLICVYDDSALPQPLMNLAAPRGGTCDKGAACWSKSPKAATGSLIKKFAYKDKLRTPDGLEQAQLSSSITGKGSLKFKGKSINLHPPVLSTLDLPVRVQVRRADALGTCWEAIFNDDVLPDRIIKNDGLQFKAKSN